MSSWLARSLANSLTLNDDDDHDEESACSRDEENDDVIHLSQSSATPNEETKAKEVPQSLSPQQVDQLHSHDIKEDLTQLKDGITRQLFGVASFLASPPSTQFSDQSNDRSFSILNQPQQSDQSISRDEEDPSDSVTVAGIRDDFSEIGGTLSKMASDYLPFGLGEDQEENELENGSGQEEEEEDHEFNVARITDEVLAFARNIAHHPETWLDFPLDPDEDLDGNLHH
ncbi:hypothetical protein V6N11_053440 [Hibiscus sabdariffa]|uniref:BSD domain-containing protein n=1 Tax=Hibiscus sabdariffa TaxID=183260 RepID=A0ABR2UDH3_9ROSI